jgi:6-phosphogluconolactonase (cycloisomerase 2 family)
VDVVIAPDGKYAYVVNLGSEMGLSGSISQFAVAADGTLTPLTPAAVALDDLNPINIAIDPTGRYAYLTGRAISTFEGHILQYRLGSNGTLTPITTEHINLVTPTVRSPTVDPFLRSVYFEDSIFNRVLRYGMQADGNLAPQTPYGVFSETLFPVSFAIEPFGMYAYAGCAATIAQYSIDDEGALTLMPNSPRVDYANDLVVDFSGKYVYTISANPENKVFQYQIGSGGELVPLTPATLDVPPIPVAIAISP